MLDEGCLQVARESVDTQEYRELTIASVLGRDGVVDALNCSFGLFQTGGIGQHANRMTYGIFREQALRLALLVVGDQQTGRLKDRFRAPIVALQGNYLGIGKIALEIKDVANIRSAPLI